MGLRFFTSGESHGYGILAFIEGLPSGLRIDLDFVNIELRRRQLGFGRGGRMKIEFDEATFLSGVYRGETVGAPITILVRNRDWENWKDIMDPFCYRDSKSFFVPRPGHADLPGALKYNIRDLRAILERASARETAGRVAGGAIFKLFLKEFGINIASYVKRIGPVEMERKPSWEEMISIDDDPLRCPDREVSEKMVECIKRAIEEGDTLGGVFVVTARNVPVGLGSHVQWDRRLDARIAMAMMSIQGVKAVSIGEILEDRDLKGSNFHDEIYYSKSKGFYRLTNRAGGIEGGITNGEDIVVYCYMKPIPTLRNPLRSVNILTKEPSEAHRERSDVSAVAAASIVGEAMLAFVLADAILEKFGSDNMRDIIANYENYINEVKNF
ncbi:MAG: chorismate synthase [Thermosulfidibacteraceae bacterium]|jgi:chorismate synthase